jgi:hypothetical protein
MLEVIILESKSLDKARDFALVVTADGFLLLFDGLGNLSVKVLLLEINDFLKVLEHAIH